MQTISTLLQFLLKLDPPKNAARLAFYNYLKNLSKMDQVFTIHDLHEFFQRCLKFQHWQENQNMLGQCISSDLQEFAKQGPLNIGSDEIQRASEIQVIPLKNLTDFFDILKQKINQEKKPGEKLQFIQLEKNRILALKLNTLCQLECLTYSPSAVILKGQLLPIVPDTHLIYNAQMELKEGVLQLITTSIMGLSSFELSGGKCQGTATKGFNFQKEESIYGTLIHKPNLFYAIKSLEKYFIKPESDPFYSELANILEKSTELLKSRHPDGEKISMEALKRGRMAIKNIFPNDKLLRLLVSNLEHHLRAINPNFEGPIPRTQPVEDLCRPIRPLNQ